MSEDTKLILSNELHRRLDIQARNLLFEYKYGVTDSAAGKIRGHVPVEHVEKLMRLYGNLVAEVIFEDQEKAKKSAQQKLIETKQKAEQ